MKRETLHFYEQVANDALYYIYRYFESDITLAELASNAKLSEYHFHRIFSAIVGRTFFETLQSVRLQKAANLLITNQFASISEVGQLCGYTSHSAFIRAFKRRFGTTPSAWRKGGYSAYSKEMIAHSPFVQQTKEIEVLSPVIEKSPERRLFYLRHKGYNQGIKTVWNRLKGHLLEANIVPVRMFGIHHDNPTLTNLCDASYVAAIEVDDPNKLEGKLSSFIMPASLCAKFHYEGVYGEVLPLMHYIYHIWLPQSGFEAKVLPPYAVYHRNHFLDEAGQFSLDFYLPIQSI